MTHDLVVPPTEGDGLTAGAGPSAAPAAPFTAADLDAVTGVIWEGLDEDPTRFDDLLWSAVAFIGRIALESQPPVSTSAAVMLRALEHRALWGPDLEQEDHR